ncbi:hypothetical protein GC177_10335 [bacterium]|nr:hypothetical protein [bacterium]
MEKLSKHAGKIPQVTLAFWIIKIAATTLGETGGDAFSMSLDLGYAVSTVIFALFFSVALLVQMRSAHYHPFTYWTVIVTTTTVGTTLADFMDRSLGFGYEGGVLLLFIILLALIAVWKRACGSISIHKIRDWRGELFYWCTILSSNTLGTALGDWLANDPRFGYSGGAALFLAILAVIAMLYYTTRLSRTALFWLAFVITRPLGATLGDILTKPVDAGGLDLSRFTSSAVLLGMMITGILLSSCKRRNAMPAKDQAIP